MMAGRGARSILQRRSRNGRRTGFGARFFCVVLFAAAAPAGANDPTLAEVTELADSGAAQLALRVLDRGQPKAAEAAAEWQRWERLRVRVLETLEDWEAIARRLAEPPADAPAGFRRWAREKRARALLALERPRAARAELARLIWTEDGGTPASEDLARWRRLVVRAYQAGGRHGDAYAALLRYRQDYGSGDGEQALLQAQVLLANGLPVDAASVLEAVDGPRAEALRQLARVRADGTEAHRVLPVVRELAENAGLDARGHRLAWAAMAEAAARAGEPAARVVALERLMGTTGAAGESALFEAGPADLWRAYLEYARAVGNRAQLLLGEDAAWFGLAEEAAERQQPVRRRAVLALLARQAGTPADRHKAGDALAADLLERPWGLETAERLFLEAPAEHRPGAAPDALLRALVDRAIARGDLARASRLQARVAEPPEGSDRVRAALRRAKVFILGGRPAEGIDTLQRLLREGPGLGPDPRDRLLQLVFDLQTLGEHDAALRLFEALLSREERAEVRRELYYWMADSRSALDEHQGAARLYLRSAMLPGPETMDPWAQSARYQASKSLTEAGLLDDAAALLRRLLEATEEPGRRAVIRRDLQQLNLEKGRGDAQD